MRQLCSMSRDASKMKKASSDWILVLFLVVMVCRRPFTGWNAFRISEHESLHAVTRVALF